MLFSLLAFSLQAAAPNAVAPVPHGKFTDLPNIAVAYYDVTGANVRDLHASIVRQSRRDPVTGKAVPAASDWSIKAGVTTSTTAGKCKITGATVAFAGNARMPRLAQAAGQPIDPALLARWQRYAAELESRQVTQLRFAYDRLPVIRSQLAASSCERWKTVAAAAIDKLKRDAAAARAANPLPPPAL